MIDTLNIRQLAERYPDAYNALPEPYQSDDCLTFDVQEDGRLYAYPSDDQRAILGDWRARYHEDIKEWKVYR